MKGGEKEVLTSIERQVLAFEVLTEGRSEMTTETVNILLQNIRQIIKRKPAEDDDTHGENNGRRKRARGNENGQSSSRSSSTIVQRVLLKPLVSK